VPTLKITSVDSAEAEIWRLAREVSGLLRNLPWVLIGGLMVRIIEAEHGITTQWTTGDVDTVLDIRAVSTATEEASRRLMAARFEPERQDGNLTYRFVRGNDVVDVLAPDNMGDRANLTTVPPDATMEALGSRQALDRSRTVTLDAGDGPFDLPVPSLVGAFVIKARVVGNVQRKEVRAKHERDLARLLALVADPVAARAELSRNERGYLRQRADMVNAAHPAWARVPNAEDGAIALSILINSA
jgi:hypothetical protein